MNKPTASLAFNNLESVDRTLSRLGAADFLHSIPKVPDHLYAQRGFHDRRAFALRYLKIKNLTEARPKTLAGALMLEACIDALGEMLFHRDGKGMDGVARNISDAQCYLADENRPAVEGYDFSAYIVAAKTFRLLVPAWADATPHLDTLLREENTERAAAKSLYHHLLDTRLAKNLDILRMLLDEHRDLDALVWYISRQITEKADEEEIRQYLVVAGALAPDGQTVVPDPADEKAEPKSFASLRELYESGSIASPSIKNELRQQFADADAEKKAQLETIRDAVREREAGESFKHAKLLLKGIGGAAKLIAEGIKAVQAMTVTTSVKKEPETPRIQGRYKRPVFPYYPQERHKGDKVSQADELITPEESAIILEGLFTTYAGDLRKVNREARLLAQRLRAAFDIKLERELEEGTLDPAGLTRLIVDPLYGTPFRRFAENVGESLDTAVTLLVDNSGSMNSCHKIQLAYLATERLSFWLSHLGIQTEILGFTTLAQTALPAFGDIAKTIVSPSRNEKIKRIDPVHHIVYKSRHEVHSPRVTARMAAMLRGGLHLSNCDGESVLWAHDRLLAAENKRKILAVVSDGQPSFSINNYRSNVIIPIRHLTDVVRHIEKTSPCEIVGIGVGVGSGVTNFYSRSIEITQAKDLTKAMSLALRTIIDPAAKAPSARRRSPQTPVRADFPVA